MIDLTALFDVSVVFLGARAVIDSRPSVVITLASRIRGPSTPLVAFSIDRWPIARLPAKFQHFSERTGLHAAARPLGAFTERLGKQDATAEAQKHPRSPFIDGAALGRHIVVLLPAHCWGRAPQNNSPWGQTPKTTMPHSGMTPAELAKFMSRGRRKNPEDEEPIFMRLDRIVDERAILKDRHAAGHAAAQALQATIDKHETALKKWVHRAEFQKN